MALFWLSDEAWAGSSRICRKTSLAPGGLMKSGIIHVLRSAAGWCDCPADTYDDL